MSDMIRSQFFKMQDVFGARTPKFGELVTVHGTQMMVMQRLGEHVNLAWPVRGRSFEAVFKEWCPKGPAKNLRPPPTH